MKTNILIPVIIIYAFLMGCTSKEKEKKASELYQPLKTIREDPVKRGEYLVNSIGCHDCHTPKKLTEKGMELDYDRLLAGHPANEKLGDYDEKTAKSYALFTMGLTASIGPWGTSFASNLTPHDTGIGTWTEDQFLNCIKKGVYKGLDGSRPLLPPMPWYNFKNLSDDDLKAVFAYLKSIKAVDNLVPAPIPPRA